MKIGLFFGSFNPIHVGHLILASTICDNSDLDKIWFVVSPQNPLKKNKTLLHEFDRLDLVREAIKEDDRFEVTDIEFTMPRPSYTVDTLVYLKEKYSSYDFTLIMGEDNLNTFHKWKNHQIIIDRFSVVVYPRLGFVDKNNFLSFGSVSKVEAPEIQVSSTLIRKNIKDGRSIKYLVPSYLEELILSKGFYSL